MIDWSRVRELVAEGNGPIVLDMTGARVEIEGVGGDAPAPALVVTEITEAVKQVEGDQVTGFLDRDELWGVQGFVLDPAVVSRLPEEIDSPSALIEAVGRAGLRWSVLPVPPPGRDGTG